MHTRSTVAMLIAGVVGGSLACGCGSSTGDDQASAYSEPTYTQTVVQLSPDAPARIVATRRITRAEQEAERDGLLHLQPAPHAGIGTSTISSDSKCSAGDLRVWDAINYSGDEICFTGTGSAVLSDYFIVPGLLSWSHNIFSYSPAGHAGYWKNGATILTPTIQSNVDVATTSASIQANATNLYLSK